MKLEIKRQDFLKAWQTAEKIAVSKAVLEIPNSIRIEASLTEGVTLEATDLKTSVKSKAEGAEIIEPGTAIVPVALLGGMLKKLKCDVLTIEVNDTKGMMYAENSKTRFSVVPAENFPDIPESSGHEVMCVINSRELSNIILEGATASSQPQDFPKYLGTCLMRTDDSKLRIVSTDGKRLAVSEKLCSMNRAEDTLVPSQAFKELAKQLAGYDEDVKIYADESTVWFALENVEFSIRKIDASFPDYVRILNSNVHTALHISCEDLLSVVERIDLIAKTTMSHIMVMDMNTDGTLRVYARSNEGVAGEFLTADITGNNAQIGFNAAYFLEGLKALGEGEINIEFSGVEEQTRMKRKDSDEFLYMLMPSRLSQQDILDDDLNDSYSTESNDDMNMPEGDPVF